MASSLISSPSFQLSSSKYLKDYLTLDFCREWLFQELNPFLSSG
jgi:hypothetical protein